MNQLANCPQCNQLFLKTTIQTVCNNCFEEEERSFDIVYKFLRKQSNRQSTIAEIVDATEVDEELILKFIRLKRLQISQFPNINYPCERCGKPIRKNKLCSQCEQDIHSQISQMNQEDERKREIESRKKDTYYAINPKND